MTSSKLLTDIVLKVKVPIGCSKDNPTELLAARL
jgi:hypothetical protein